MSWAAEQAAAFYDLASVFDASATWHPSSGATSILQTPVLFDAPTKGLGLDAPGQGLNSRFDYTDFVLTAMAKQFPGLKPAVDSGSEEVISIDEAGLAGGLFYVRAVRFVGDGKFIEARLSDNKGGTDAGQDRGQPDQAIARLLAGDG